MSSRAWLALFAAAIFAGCNGNSSAPNTGGPNTASPNVVSPPESLPPQLVGQEKPGLSPAAVNVIIGDEKKLAEMIAAHKGHVVYVDFWATWCGPCVEGFPHSVELAHKHKEKGLATIA